MASGMLHTIVTTAALAAAAAKFSANSPRDLPNPALSGIVGALYARLPDLIEPATHPRHRQFFHSAAIAVLLCRGLKALWKWVPETEEQRLLRHLVLIAGGAYLIHLAMDSMTPSALPLVGSI